MPGDRIFKKLAKGISGLIGSLIVLFILLYFNLDSNMTYPYIGTLALAAVSAVVIFTESNKNRYEITLSEKKYNKAVELLNRTKIKYVNNVSVLDYNREKFGVKNAADFEELWGNTVRRRNTSGGSGKTPSSFLRVMMHCSSSLTAMRFPTPRYGWCRPTQS